LVVGLVVAGGEEACKLFAPDLSNVIALQVVVDDTVEQFDTLRARALLQTAGGDTSGAPVYWESLDTTILAVLDSTTGLYAGVLPGATDLEAWSGNLRSAPIPIIVTPLADTLVAMSASADTVSAGSGDSVSDSLQVVVADTTTIPPATSPSATPPLAGRPVTFSLTPAALGAATTLVTTDTTHTGAALDTVLTNSAGIAAIQVRYLGGGTLPDSVVVTARAQRAIGTAVPGSPLTFVVYLVP
jgi:hypothetical protein